MTAGARTVLVDGLGFPEAPRWHDGRLWYSDMAVGDVAVVTPDGRRETVCTVAGGPSGLGWLPDGRMLVVSMHDRSVLRREPDGELVVHADCSALVRADLNDMVVDDTGTAWVTNFGYDPAEDPVTTGIVRVRPDGTSALVGGELLRPNGIALAPDRRTLVVNETRVHRVTAFTVTDDGDLVDRRLVGDLGEGSWADGLCLDAEGAAWVGDPMASRCVRVVPGAGVVESIETEVPAVACVLGGPDRRTLHIVEAPLRAMAENAADRRGRVELVTVEVPGAGWP